MSGLGNQGGGPRREASLGQVSKATSGGGNTPGTINAGKTGGGGGSMGAVKTERPQSDKKDGGLGN